MCSLATVSHDEKLGRPCCCLKTRKPRLLLTQRSASGLDVLPGWNELSFGRSPYGHSLAGCGEKNEAFKRNMESYGIYIYIHEYIRNTQWTIAQSIHNFYEIINIINAINAHSWRSINIAHVWLKASTNNNVHHLISGRRIIAAQMQVPNGRNCLVLHDFHGRNWSNFKDGFPGGHLGPNVMRIFCWKNLPRAWNIWKPCQGRQRSDRRSPQNLGLNRGW